MTREELDRAKAIYDRVRADPYKKLEIDLNLMKLMIDTLEKLYNEEEAKCHKTPNKS